MQSFSTFFRDNAAIVIATCALVLTAYQVSAIRRHNRLSVKPHLAFVRRRRVDSHEGALSLEVTNNGLGPAIIESLEVSFDARKLLFSCSAELQEKIFELLQRKIKKSSVFTFGRDDSIRKDQTVEILRLEFSVNSQGDVKEIESRFQRLAIVIHYRSIYGEPFSCDVRTQ